MRKVGFGGLVVTGLGALVGGCTNNAAVNYVTARVVYDKVVGSGEGDVEKESKHVFSKPIPAIEMREWRDYNGDKLHTSNEIFDEIGDSVNLSEVGVRIDIPYWDKRPLIVSYTLFDSNNKVLASMDCYQRFLTINRGTLFPGKYTLKAEQGSDISLLREFEVTR